MLPDDKKIILPLARRTNGKKICVKRAAPVIKSVKMIDESEAFD